MTIASRRQPTKINASGTNFILHSMRIVSGPPIAAWRFRPLPSGVPEELLDATASMSGTYIGAAPQRWKHGPSGLHTFWFDGSANLINLYTSQLNTVLDMTEISVSLWAKVDSLADWTDSTQRYILQLKTDSNNLLEISKSTSNDVIDFDYTANSTADTEAVDTLTAMESPTKWMHLGFTISDTNDEFYSYFNGKQGSKQTGIGTWSGNLSSTDCVVGCDSTTPGATMWLGGISDLIIWDRILSADEFYKLANVP